jgi:hypothetical protein
MVDGKHVYNVRQSSRVKSIGSFLLKTSGEVVMPRKGVTTWCT